MDFKLLGGGMEAVQKLDSAKLNSLFVVTLVQACQEVFKTQCTTPLTAGKSFVYQGQGGLQVDIAATIGVTASTMKGSIALAFPTNTFCTIASKMLGETYTEITAEIRDVGAEILNIVFGVAKAKFKDTHGVPIELAIPVVLQGQNLIMKVGTSEPTLCIPFNSDAGAFFATISFTKGV